MKPSNSVLLENKIHGLDHEAKVKEIIEAGRSLLAPEIWDYIIESDDKFIESNVEFSVVLTSTDTKIAPCHPTQTY